MWSTIKQVLIAILLYFGFKSLVSKNARQKLELEQNEIASKIMARQRDVNINSVADADKLFKELDDRN